MLHYIEYTIDKPSYLLHNQRNEQIYCLNSKLILMQFPSSLFIAGESLLPLPPRRLSFLSGVKCSSQFTLSICHSNMPQALAPSNTHTHAHNSFNIYNAHSHTRDKQLCCETYQPNGRGWALKLFTNFFSCCCCCHVALHPPGILFIIYKPRKCQKWKGKRRNK